MPLADGIGWLKTCCLNQQAEIQLSGIFNKLNQSPGVKIVSHALWSWAELTLVRPPLWWTCPLPAGPPTREWQGYLLTPHKQTYRLLFPLFQLFLWLSLVLFCQGDSCQNRLDKKYYRQPKGYIVLPPKARYLSKHLHVDTRKCRPIFQFKMCAGFLDRRCPFTSKLPK